MTITPERFSWFALRVRTRHEAGVADFLEGKGYELFLPLYTCRKRWSDRIKNVKAPLFPGYLFCRFDPQNRLPILKTPGVIQIAGYNRTPAPVEESEIQAIQAVMASGLPNRPWPFLGVGDRVRVEAGPLRGHEGVLLEFRGGHRLVLSITLLHRSVAVEIDSAFVESLGNSAAGGLQKVDPRFRSLPLAV
jgi:transcriptional antiterminator NusG